jgi:hypothetical protein
MDSSIARHKGLASIIGRLFLAMMQVIHRDFQPDGRKIDAVWGEFFVAVVIFVHTERHKKPISSTAISAAHKIPRTNVRRYTNTLVRHGSILRVPGGFIFNPEYIPNTRDRKARLRLDKFIRAAAAELVKLRAKLECWPIWPAVLAARQIVEWLS